ncbi:MAG TPA: M3 family metallopeptidase [Candidatus Paceibacterota bacterium]
MNRRPYAKEDFLWTQWSPEEIRKVAREAVSAKRSRYEEIKKIPAKGRTFENTIKAIEDIRAETMPKINSIDFLMNVSPNKEVREVAKKAIDEVEVELVKIEYDDGMYRAFQEYVARKEKLEGEDKKLFEDMAKRYKRMGFALSPSAKKRFRSNLKKLLKLEREFSKNINDYQDQILVTRGELEGLPEAYIGGLKKDKDGKYIVTLAYPDIIPFMENATNEQKRKELAEKNLQKGGKQNLKIIKQILRLRHENARLLGYQHHADFATELKMVKNGSQAKKFVSRLLLKLKKGLKKDLAEMLSAKRRLTGNKKAKIEFYDTAYYSNQIQKEKFSVDQEKVREYFPLEVVLKGTFEIYSKLFSVVFELVNSLASSQDARFKLWHEDVQLYVVKDKAGQIMGYFALDLFPREGKYSHAAEFGLVSGRQLGENYVAPFCSMVANFAKPGKDSPSLLSHDEVETFFHEFGHVMHEVLTVAKYAFHAGTSVALDFVELPSQMLEYWVWDKETLKILSGHFKNHSDKLPPEMLKNLLKTKKHMISLWSVRQLVQTLFDLELHLGPDGFKKVEHLHRQLTEKYLGIKLPKNAMFAAGFGHLVGYDAGYYSYMWAKVYAADAFARFKKEGMLNSETGADYRKCVLEKGSSVEESKLIKGFLGRKPNNKEFLKEICGG